MKPPLFGHAFQTTPRPAACLSLFICWNRAGHVQMIDNEQSFAVVMHATLSSLSITLTTMPRLRATAH
eukprot:scaffold54512_cov37-Tisochrysis_lutea.AAC.2